MVGWRAFAMLSGGVGQCLHAGRLEETTSHFPMPSGGHCRMGCQDHCSRPVIPEPPEPELCESSWLLALGGVQVAATSQGAEVSSVSSDGGWNRRWADSLVVGSGLDCCGEEGAELEGNALFIYIPTFTYGHKV